MPELTSHFEPPLPGQVLYATSARIGGSGLSGVAFESLKGLHHEGILAQAIGYDNRQDVIPAQSVRTLRWHPVRLLSFLGSSHYYGAKRQYLDGVAARELEHGGYDFFHGWSGDALASLRMARRLGIPSVLEIPTWHRNKGKVKPWMTAGERRAREEAPFHRRWLDGLLVDRQRVLEEYDLASLILVLSEKAIETFEAAGIDRSRLFKLERGVDVQRFQPASPPPCFRVVFVGALIERKGVHHLLEAWHRLNLRDAELVLVGSVHEEIRPALKAFGKENVKVVGFDAHPERFYQQASLHVLPSSCEGSAKTTYEAAACALPQITTREAGDVVIDGVNGLVIPPDNVEALAEALQYSYDHPERLQTMGAAARERVVAHYTWDHFRARLLDAYRCAMTR